MEGGRRLTPEQTQRLLGGIAMMSRGSPPPAPPKQAPPPQKPQLQTTPRQQPRSQDRRSGPPGAQRPTQEIQARQNGAQFPSSALGAAGTGGGARNPAQERRAQVSDPAPDVSGHIKVSSAVWSLKAVAPNDSELWCAAHKKARQAFTSDYALQQTLDSYYDSLDDRCKKMMLREIHRNTLDILAYKKQKQRYRSHRKATA